MRESFMNPRPTFRLFSFSLGIAATALAISRAEPTLTDSTKKKIVFIAGNPSHGPGQHEHRAGCMLLADHLNKSGLPVQAVVTTNGWPKDNSIFEGASAVVIYADGGGRHPAVQHLAELKEMASKGVGIGCLHYGVEVPKGEAGDVFLDVIGGYFETDWSVNPTWEASYKMPEHAVTRGVHDFKCNDEWYYHMRFPEGMKGVTPILTDLPPPSTLTRKDGPHEGNPEVRAAVLERKEPQHTMWLFERPENLGGGRGFGFCGGHYHKNWQQDDMRRLVLNSIVWISGIEVPADGVLSKTPTDEEMAANLDKKR
jgi:type 1 glutamine amidotransferase